MGFVGVFLPYREPSSPFSHLEARSIWEYQQRFLLEQKWVVSSSFFNSLSHLSFWDKPAVLLCLPLELWLCTVAVYILIQNIRYCGILVVRQV